MSRRVAIFVDADNVNSCNSDRILTKGNSLGELAIIKAYGNKNTLTNWEDHTKFQMVYSGDGKNAADLHMAIDALEFVLTLPLDTAMICSSDGDFSHLARRLRDHGKTVIGMGETKTPMKFQDACNEFVVLPSKEVEIMPSQPANISKFDLEIKEMIQKHSEGGKGILMSVLNQQMQKEHGTQIKQHANSWRQYLRSKEELFSFVPNGAETMVRFLPKGFGPNLKLVNNT